MKVTELKCPSCSAPISLGTMKCQYCGAYLIVQNNALALKSLSACPKCGAMVGEGSFFCNNCEELLAKSSEDLNFLRSTLKKVKLLQDKWRKLIGQIDATQHTKILEKLERDEFIYFFIAEKIVPNVNVFAFWVVTNKRVLFTHSDGKVFKVDADMLYEDIAFVTEPTHVTLSGLTFYRVVISLFQGDEVSFFNRDYENAYEFYKMCTTAHEDYESARDLKRKDTILLLWKSRDKI